jgi:hypothetical protein
LANQSWADRANHYETRIKDIRILPIMEGQDIRQVVAAMDEVLNEAFFDLSEVQSNYEETNAILQTRIAELFLEGKDAPEGGARGGGMSDEKAKAYSRAKVSEEGIVAMKLEAERTLTFMENVISLLKEKRALLTVSYGTVKIESTLA